MQNPPPTLRCFRDFPPWRYLGLLLGVFPAPATWACAQANIVYRVEFDRTVPVASSDNQPPTFVTTPVRFRRVSDGQPTQDIAAAEIVVTENGGRVRDVIVGLPGNESPINVMLALDGTTPGNTTAAGIATLLDDLGNHVHVGCVQYDRSVQRRHSPTNDTGRKRNLIGDLKSQPSHRSTAYRDAALEAIGMLAGTSGRKAVVVQVSAADTHSRHSLEEVIAEAIKHRVPVYTLGLGTPSRREPMSVVVVLDPGEKTASGAGRLPELRVALGRFLDALRADAALSLLDAGGRASPTQSFTEDRGSTRRELDLFQPAASKAPLDAVYVGVAMLEAARRPGKQAVVLISDSVDLDSRRRPEEVVTAAKSVGVPIHVLGLGPPRDEDMLRQIAAMTGGTYQGVRDLRQLAGACDELALRLSELGIDEEALRRLAEKTGGRYFAVQDAARLADGYRSLAGELQCVYSVTFPARLARGSNDLRDIDIYVVRDGVPISPSVHPPARRPGALVPELDPYRFLVLLALVGGLLGVRRWRRTAVS